MHEASMTLEILLPFQVFTEESLVVRIVFESATGSYGLLPNRLDCVAALIPGIFCYETKDEGERFLAIDEGLLIKTGAKVSVSVRRALRGADLSELRSKVESEFLDIDSEERQARATMARLETGFVHRFMALHHE